MWTSTGSRECIFIPFRHRTLAAQIPKGTMQVHVSPCWYRGTTMDLWGLLQCVYSVCTVQIRIFDLVEVFLHWYFSLWIILKKVQSTTAIDHTPICLQDPCSPRSYIQIPHWCCCFILRIGCTCICVHTCSYVLQHKASRTRGMQD